MWTFILTIVCYVTHANTHYSGVKTYGFRSRLSLNKNLQNSTIYSSAEPYVSLGTYTNRNEDNSMYYTICENSVTPYEELCNITKLTYVYDNVTMGKSCKNIKLFPTKNIVMSYPSMQNRVLLQFEPSWVILDMNSCAIITLEHEADDRIVLFEDFWEIITTSKKRCGSEGTCKIKYDYNGSRIGKPSSFTLRMDGLSLINPTDPSSPDTGYFIVQGRGAALKMMYSDSAGVVRTKQDFKFDSQASINNNLTAWCFHDPPGVACKQIGAGGLTLNIKFDDDLGDYNKLNVFSLGEGKVLIVALRKEIHGEKILYTSVHWRYVDNKESQQSKWLDDTSLHVKCDMHVGADIHLQLSYTGEDYCLIVACKNTTEKWIEMIYRKQCISKKNIMLLSRSTFNK